MATETLTRTTFETSRLLEFFTEKELTMQIGQRRHLWPLALLKELIDNALDACENAGVQPVVRVEIGDHYFSVADNGPGLNEKTIARSLDYTVRVSDKSYYVSPTRGQLGNALKCVYAAPFVVSGESGRVEIETGGSLYSIDVSLDRIAQAPSLDLTTQHGRPERDGTKVTIFWPESASLLDASNSGVFYNDKFPLILTPESASLLGVSETYNFYNDVKTLIYDYSMLNPHATFVSNGESIEATNPLWEKWKPSSPTSAYWYDAERLRGLIAAYLTAERGNDAPKTIREFITEFRGLAGTAKQKKVAEDAGLHGKLLIDLVKDGDIMRPPVERLLSAMKEHSRPVKPPQLGIIGQEHIAERMAGLDVSPESIRYKKIARPDEETGWPYVLEVAFGVYTQEQEQKRRRIITGLNWSPTLGIPVREFQAMLGEMRVDRDDPVCVVLHIARPQFEFLDRGKAVLDV